MTVKNITKTEEVVTTKTVNAGVQWQSAKTERAVRLTPSSSVKGAYTITISNPDSDNELAVILKKADAEAFFKAAYNFVVYGR